MSWASFHVSDCRSTLSFSTAASCGSTRIYEPSRGWSPFGFPPTFAILSCTQIFVDLGECFWGHVPRSPCVLSKPPRRMQERAGLRGATQETKGLVWVAACRVLFPGAQEAGGGPYQRGEGRNSVLHKHTKRGFTVQEAPAYSRPRSSVCSRGFSHFSKSGTGTVWDTIPRVASRLCHRGSRWFP